MLNEFPEEEFSCYGDGYARVSDRYDCGYARVWLYTYVSFHYAYEWQDVYERVYDYKSVCPQLQIQYLLS